MVINNPRPFGVCVFTRLDDHFWAHPKVLNCSDGAIALWTRALSWVGFQLTDGFVPHQCLRLLRGRKRDADRLVAAGLWVRGECDGQLGYWFHDFTDWNNATTRGEVEKRRKRGHDRVIKHREKTTDWTELPPDKSQNPGSPDTLDVSDNTPAHCNLVTHAPEADTLPVLAAEPMPSPTTSATPLPAYSAPPEPNLETTTAPAAAPTPATTPATQPKLKPPATTTPSKLGPLPDVCGQSPADWSTMDDPRCRKHAGLPRGQVPPCWACGQVRLWFTQQALVVKQAQRNKVAACEYCDERGLAETRDESGKRLLIRCSHDGPPPILPAPEKPQHRPPPPEIRERIAKLGRSRPNANKTPTIGVRPAGSLTSLSGCRHCDA